MKRTPFKQKIRKPLRKKRKGTFKHKAWDAFSVFVRKRDAGEDGLVRCISCQKIEHWKQMDAGHFVAAAVSLILRFNEKNVNAQCGGCNRWDDRSIHRYTMAMRIKYGPNIVEELDEIRRKGEGFRITEKEYEEIYHRYKGLTEG